MSKSTHRAENYLLANQLLLAYVIVYGEVNAANAGQRSVTSAPSTF